ncbi:hypothetical protein ACH4LN_02840 [Streptomyces albus]|uniref:Uncharacterized protein n=1 Tax=Streptomyces albus TaxID=1888 RepID=A0A8H1LKD4_9ACTN|nr:MULTISPECIES: hypothetical protein [Streptomyces]TGG86048.1 hypothetical protein D8771_06430 [Streptomyces albus]UVN53637.1 hypothetical protein NR995_03225 [Streptomyces albus]GHJ24019.1 hypothetical protein TPA0909_56330 [Streptomyces albus]
MAWRNEEFGASHEGWPGAVLADGSEPGPACLDAGSGAHMAQTREWWAYSGRLATPRAAGVRAACACGWRGERDYPVDWEELGNWRDFDDSAAWQDWSEHINDVEARSVPLPVQLEETLESLAARLMALADEAPLAALRAVGELERITAAGGQAAAHNVHADEIPWDTAAQALGLSEQAARSRIIHYSIRR